LVDGFILIVGYITPNRATRISQTMPRESVPFLDFVSVKPCH